MQVFQINSESSDKSKTDELNQQLMESEVGQRFLGAFAHNTESQQLKRIYQFFDRFEFSTVLSALERCLNREDLRPSAVHKQILDILNELEPAYNFCTAGKTAIEMTAGGDYARCLRFAGQNSYMGNILQDGQINLVDLETEADCSLRCRRRMCYARNTIRTNTRPEFDAAIEERGLYGDYRKKLRLTRPDIFLRWKITETCNYTCSYCTAWKTVNTKLYEIPVDQLLEIARIFTDQFSNISLRITGGEPSVKRNYADVMRFLHSRLDRFSEIEVRTNLSFPHKQKPVLALDWKGKLHYHIACHIYDKNFRPWDFVDILQSTDSLDYVLKFVATKTNQTYVDSFIEFFVKQGIPEDKIVIIHDIRDTDGETEIPKSYPWLQKWFENPVKLTSENLSNPFVEQSVTT